MKTDFLARVGSLLDPDDLEWMGSLLDLDGLAGFE